MKIPTNQRLLIISNNVLSNTRNNGKTILSYIDCIPVECVRQLYFSGEPPVISGYQYFRISDTDVLKGRFSPKRRGGTVEPLIVDRIVGTAQTGHIPRNATARLARELIWLGFWKSRQLLMWLDEFKPTSVFFVGGDCAFAYTICKYIVKRYRARLTLYITDDYVMPRRKESPVQFIRRSLISRKLKGCLKNANAFLTVSEPMRVAYKQRFGYDSMLAVNMTEPLKENAAAADNEYVTMVYAGSLYYGRDEVLGAISLAADRYNKASSGKQIRIKVFSNVTPDENSRALFVRQNCCAYYGSLSAEQLRTELNLADILVFVESFDERQIEKTRYSLSTKVPEYLSLCKPILAVGPAAIGSMDYLQDVAMCINNPENLHRKLTDLVSSESLQIKLSNAAWQKYSHNHNKTALQEKFVQAVFGN